MKKKNHLNEWNKKVVQHNLVLWNIAQDLNDINAKLTIHNANKISADHVESNLIKRIVKNFFD